MKKIEMKIGDEFQVDFIKNQNGGKPVCRIDGIVGFINPKERSFVAPCSTWVVQVIEIRDTFVFVSPLVKIHTAKETLDALADKIRTSFKIIQENKKEVTKLKKQYLYKSFQELKSDNL